MKKGVDFTGIVVCNLCHDGQGNYVLGFRSDTCRDEHFTWEPTGSGGLKFGELVAEGVRREVEEELGVVPINIEFLGIHEAIREIDGSKTHWIYIVNKVEVDRDTVQITEPDKCMKQGWFKKDNFPTPLMSQFPPVLEKFSSLL